MSHGKSYFVLVFSISNQQTDRLILSSQNRRCQLIYRIVIDVSDVNDKDLDQWVIHDSEISLQDLDAEDKDDRNHGHSNDIENVAEQNLLPVEGFADGPEIFKRVRFLSRWEDLGESRGSLVRSFGNVHIWGLSFSPLAKMASFQIRVMVVAQLLLYRNWILPKANQAEGLWFRSFFMGHSREQSTPVIVLFAETKRARRRALKVVEQLDWIGLYRRVSVFTCSRTVWGSQMFWQMLEQRRRLPGSISSTVHHEAEKLRKRFGKSSLTAAKLGTTLA
jgi:hypothetical protein